MRRCPTKIGMGFFLAHTDRGSGRSTRQAVEALHRLLETPGKWVTVADHYHMSLARLHTIAAAEITSRLLQTLNIPFEVRQITDQRSMDRQIQIRIKPLPQHRIYKCKTPTQSLQGLCRKSSQP